MYEDEQLPDVSGPCAIIIAPFADNVSEIEHALKMHLKEYNDVVKTKGLDKTISIVASYGKYREDYIQAELLKGVGIFVTTPPCLLRWIEKAKEKPLFTTNRIQLLAVDDFDLCRKRYGDDICHLIEHFYIKHKDGAPTQIMITSNHWESKLLQYCNYGNRPALYIANYIEAAIYGGTQIRLSFTKKDNKMHYVANFVKGDIFASKRSLIICSTDEEVVEITEYLNNLQINCTSYTHDCDDVQRRDAKDWHNETADKGFSVLVCSDRVLGDLNDLRNVERLLNYSLPGNWSTLSFRFATFFNSYHDFVKSKEVPKEYEQPFAHILVDESTEKTLPRLVEFMERIKAKIPRDVIAISRKILEEREAERKSIDLCPYFLHFGIEIGKCPKGECRGRHTLLPCDEPTDRMPLIYAVVQVKITYVHSPIHYSGQILKYQMRNASRWIQYNNRDQEFEDTDLKCQMGVYFQSAGNQRQHYPVSKGDICAWTDDNQIYQRVKVLEIQKVTSHKDPDKVTIRFIDSGEIYYGKSSINLLLLPDDLKNIPARAMDIHHVGIIPFDGDMFWGRRAKQNVKYQMEDHEKRRKSAKETHPDKEFYIKAHVVFKIENNIWTNKLAFVEVSHSEIEYSLHKPLIKDNLAERTDWRIQMSNLISMSKELGMYFKRLIAWCILCANESFIDYCDSCYAC